ncbi:hypothetical protein CCAX7_61970 [Capsulimonas corticalis]|uniref:Uncharacterized protein n=1 Tax=Capsulimonas corticalis TaxID=2219043 RepID=A0A402CWF5_9BACT|nr:restriction endonuclease [Capsulimonas corticalis]BDI34146.1 hypothetical protein CCAX7_61970 [Capsulimonas corticalis]
MKASRCACPPAGKPEEPKILRRVRERLLALSYPEFQRCLQQLMEAMGYADVAATGRTRRRGHNSDGGADLVAWLQAGVTRFRIVAQAKQLTEPVQKRSVDELRGAALRLDARQGLILTTAGVSPVARAAAASVPATPIRLIDGTELAGLMVRHGIGVIRDAGGAALDEGYWKSISSSRQAYAAAPTKAGEAEAGPDGPPEQAAGLCGQGTRPEFRFRVTVSLVRADEPKREGGQ